MLAATAAMDTALARSAEGDQAAFADLVRRHEAMVYSIALHFLRDRAAAEELAQEVFLHLYRNLASIESPGHLMNWLRKVACHRAIDQTRRLRLMPRVSLEQAPEPVSVDPESDPILAGRLERLVAGLPPRPRMIVILRYQEDMEPGEIAEALGIPIGTVKSSLHRALALLRGKLERSLKGVRHG